MLRNGKTVSKDISELVPGDIILLEEGGIVPADVKLLSTEHGKPLQIDLSSITGESLAVFKTSNDILLSSKSSSSYLFHDQKK